MADNNQNPMPGNYAGTIKVTVRGRDYYVHSSAPMPMMPLADLEEALICNRQILKDSQDKLRESFIQEAFEYAPPWIVNYDAPMQDAIQAHLNINMLVPLINLKGGHATFEKPETLNVQTRMEMMRNVAERAVFLDKFGQRNSVNTALLVSLALMLLLALILV
ncbi:MAG TPA: hypothetical protein PLE99_14830 [Candidatus Thiothrix moscowensis]|uniref:hypothetical protein n=1 Tax=unclassified Thiothrix TaxID=2636184 RepID=UPI0025F0A2AC|nr:MULTISPECIES: hypothetical protein [unclassified Thiothrix]HRJ54030.1 hypothetical protein [Candidatus Thiothrix moscowensis]HRJ94112.1 hypothetical protein [Candidatus Thiothrix moscowensis]